MKLVGIDFGTGNSVLAGWYGKNPVVFNSIGDAGMVNADILIGGDGLIIPDPSLITYPVLDGKIEKSIKRRLIEAIENADDVEVDYLSELVEKKIKFIFEEYLKQVDEKIVKAVITCPANTGQAYRSILLEIGRKIGLPSVDVVDEPTAAAVHHGMSEVATKAERWMVIDWGCGTCDVSLISREIGSKDLKVICVRGDNNLGGTDMDQLLLRYLMKKYDIKKGVRSIYEIEDIKIALSNKDYYEKKITLEDGSKIDVSCERTELEKLIQPLLQRGEELIEDALTSANWGDVDEVIATGGPILMPSVLQMICEATDREEDEINCKDPLTSVALGAARLAELKRIGGYVVTNKVTKSIGIRVVEDDNEDVYHKVIQRDEDRPVRRSVKLTTSVDLQDIIEIEIREGDNKASAKANTLLASLSAAVRPDNKGAIQTQLNIALSESGDIEAYLEALNDQTSVREVKALGINISKNEEGLVNKELRLSEPLQEFREQVWQVEADPDTARQVYERLKLKFHPDRDPDNRDHWNKCLSDLDESYNKYLEDVEKRMRASSVPDLDWDDKSKLNKIVIDETLAHRLTHCLANNIGDDEQTSWMHKLLKRYPDYRRVLASYLFGVKRNDVLQEMLSEDDRPHVGLVVLLQNIPDKEIRERHEVLKAAYRVDEAKVRELLLNPDLDIESLYDLVPKLAEAPVNPIGSTKTQNKVNLIIQHKSGNTYITGNTFPVKESIKQAAKIAGGRARWDGSNKQWIVDGFEITEKDIYES